MNQTDYLIKHLKAALFWCCFFMFILFWLSFDNNHKSEYTSELEKLAAACLSSSAGKPIKIGDDYYLCGATKL